MIQAIPIFIINLARRPDRLERISAHLDERGVRFNRTDAVDVKSVEREVLDATIQKSGPLGTLGDGDRACTTSHFKAFEEFLTTDADYALFLEDDVYLSADIADLLCSTEWIDEGLDAIKLEKFGDGSSTVLLGKKHTELPVKRSLHRLSSRHVGGGAYILSRKGAQAALDRRGKLKVPIDHFLFNPNVSSLARTLKPVIVQPAMATQRAYAYNSDISGLGKAAKPKGWRLVKRKFVRGFHEINLLPQQLFLMVTGKARWQEIFFKERVDE